MSKRFISMVLVSVVLTMLAMPVGAQQGIVKIAKVYPQFYGDTLLAGVPVRIVLRYTNNTPQKVDIANGFAITSPDGAMWDSVTIDTLGYTSTGVSTFASYFDKTFVLAYAGNDFWLKDTVAVLGLGTGTKPAKQLPAGFDDTALAITVWFNSLVSAQKHLCIDSSFYMPGGTWVWVGQDLTDYHPDFQGLPGHVRSAEGYCFFLYQSSCWYCPGCCHGVGVGNVNMVGVVDLSDLSGLVNYLTGGGYRLPCDETANVNGSGIVDLGDLSCLVSYLTGGGYVMPNCP